MADTVSPDSSHALPGEGITQKPNTIKHLHGRHKRTSDPFRQLDTQSDGATDVQGTAAAAPRDGEGSKPQSILMDVRMPA